jgi:hypothetical protein
MKIKASNSKPRKNTLVTSTQRLEKPSIGGNKAEQVLPDTGEPTSTLLVNRLDFSPLDGILLCEKLESSPERNPYSAGGQLANGSKQLNFSTKSASVSNNVSSGTTNVSKFAIAKTPAVTSGQLNQLEISSKRESWNVDNGEGSDSEDDLPSPANLLSKFFPKKGNPSNNPTTPMQRPVSNLNGKEAASEKSNIEIPTQIPGGSGTIDFCFGSPFSVDDIMECVDIVG